MSASDVDKAVRTWAAQKWDVDPSAVAVSQAGALEGGTQSASITRLVVTGLHGHVEELVLKDTWYAELAALRALHEVSSRVAAVPTLVAGEAYEEDPEHEPGHPLSAAWVVIPLYEGGPVDSDRFPPALFESLAEVHATWLGRADDIDGVIRADAKWFSELCLDHVTEAVVDSAGAHEGLVARLAALGTDGRVAEALACLPTTLCHGDVHPGNVVVGHRGAVLIDWANARVGPPFMDIVNMTGRDSRNAGLYLARLQELAGDAWPEHVYGPAWTYAVLQINVQYLPAGLKAHGVDYASGMLARAEEALGKLGREVEAV